ncbi:hypothetical protein MGSAQ_003136 [marine sediment metagenome]|uniref:Uncharacterized protein n=1 Tax=marine sediment metagenome TaxID=412755 RepID=A0A1B6NPX0_9ZZZZ
MNFFTYPQAVWHFYNVNPVKKCLVILIIPKRLPLRLI